MSLPQRYTLLSSWMKHGRKVVSFWREKGLVEGFQVFRQLKEIQHGELKGVDKYGNQYWEDPTVVTGRNRYVIYSSRKNVNASNVTPEWHSWLHYMQDSTPVDKPPATPSFKVQYQPMTLSKQGSAANYLPPGHLLSERHTTYGKTGEGASSLTSTYEAWQSSKTAANPEQAAKYAPKTERR